jgi:hypothetical protein
MAIDVSCEMMQYSAVQCSAVQYSTVQCSTVQCSTVQYGTVQDSIVQYLLHERTRCLCVVLLSIRSLIKHRA